MSANESDRVTTGQAVKEPASESIAKAASTTQVEARAATPALKDRIADLKLAARAKAVGATLSDRMKAVQAAAPAASDVRDRVRAAAGAVRLDKLNRETLKAGRDGLAAKVEQLLKPRPVDEPPAVKQSVSTAASSQPATNVSTDELVTQRPDIVALKARLDGALKPKLEVEPSAPTVSPEPLSLPHAESTPPASTHVAVSTATLTTRLADVTGRVRTGINALTTPRSRPSSGDSISAAPDSAASGAGPQPGEATVEIAPEITAATERTSRTTRARTAAEAERRRPLLSFGLIATALVAGGILHILTTLAIPALNTGSAFDRLRWQLEPNSVRILTADANGQTPLPFLSADMRYAMCRYDLTHGSVQVNAVLQDLGWSLALYTPQGDNFYAVPGLDGKQVVTAFTLNTASDRLLLPVPGQRRSDTDAAQVTSPQREGLIVVRAPNRGPAYNASLDEALKAVSCRPVQRR